MKVAGELAPAMTSRGRSGLVAPSSASKSVAFPAMILNGPAMLVSQLKVISPLLESSDMEAVLMKGSKGVGSEAPASTQMLRKRTALPWSWSMSGPSVGPSGRPAAVAFGMATPS